MFEKLAYSQRVLRALSGEKQAGLALPLAAGAALVGGVTVAKKGRAKAREYHAGFSPGIADSRVEL